MTTIYEAIPTLPPRAATMVTVCVYVMLAGLAIWLSAQAGVKFVKMLMQAIEADKELARMQRQSNEAEVNFWIHENFTNKRIAAQIHEADQKALAAAAHRADQECYNKRQLAAGQKYLDRRAAE